MDEAITLKVSRQDKKFLRERAKKERLTLSAYVRTKILSGYEDITFEDIK
tara:strand:- start:1420 stop:1569 length:150 start_codon:yes stop_codon:yes gene_type:complete